MTNNINEYNVGFETEINSFVKFYENFYTQIHNNTTIPKNIRDKAGENFGTLNILIMKDVNKLSSTKQKQFYEWIKIFMKKDTEIQILITKNKKKLKNTTVLDFNIYIMSLQIHALKIFIKKNKLSSEQRINDFLDAYNFSLNNINANI